MIFLTNQGCTFFGESKNGFVISYHMDTSLTKKNERSEKRIITRTTACPRVLVMTKIERKNNKLILAAKTRRNFKRHKLQQTILG